MKMRAYIRYSIWTLVATLWAMLCFLLPDFLDNPVSSVRAGVHIAAYVMAVGGGSFFLLYLIGLNRSVAAVMLPIYGTLGAVVAYFRVAYHATITPMVIEATLHTNAGTIAGVVDWRLWLWVAGNIAVSVGLLVWRWRLEEPARKGVQVLVVLLLWAAYYWGNGRLHQSLNQRYPYHVVRSTVEYLQQRHIESKERLVWPTAEVSQPDSLTIVFVLGEALRADHLSLNGYERETCPRLSQRDNILSMPHVYTPYGYTSASVPYLMTPTESLHPERGSQYHSFVRVLQDYGYYTTWISNQDMGKTYVAFIHEADTIVFPNAGKSVFVFEPWYDEELIAPMTAIMQQQSSPRQLYVLHAIGSHWYYNNHVPEAYQQFQPLTTNRVIRSNSDEEIRNSYDNTVLYADAFMDSIIGLLEGQCAAVIYLSDHGEALGENNVYMHGNSEPATLNAACVLWYSERYKALFPDVVATLEAGKGDTCRTDFLFPTILRMAGIKMQDHDEATY